MPVLLATALARLRVAGGSNLRLALIALFARLLVQGVCVRVCVWVCASFYDT